MTTKKARKRDYGTGHYNRLPFADLERLWAREDDPSATSALIIPEACGVSRESVQRWKKRGLAWWHADEIAVALKLHPASIWGDLWWNVDQPVA